MMSTTLELRISVFIKGESPRPEGCAFLHSADFSSFCSDRYFWVEKSSPKLQRVAAGLPPLKIASRQELINKARQNSAG
jgi:hypothetical protein